MTIKQALNKFYLTWVNEYISTTEMAQYYDLSEDHLKRLIQLARDIRERDIERNK